MKAQREYRDVLKGGQVMGREATSVRLVGGRCVIGVSSLHREPSALCTYCLE